MKCHTRRSYFIIMILFGWVYVLFIHSLSLFGSLSLPHLAISMQHTTIVYSWLCASLPRKKKKIFFGARFRALLCGTICWNYFTVFDISLSFFILCLFVRSLFFSRFQKACASRIFVCTIFKCLHFIAASFVVRCAVCNAQNAFRAMIRSEIYYWIVVSGGRSISSLYTPCV